MFIFASRESDILFPMIFSTGIWPSFYYDFFEPKKLKRPVAYDIALRINMTWMIENIHQH